MVHQLCTAHLLRDLDDAAQVYPDAVWPVQIADTLRELIGQANLARDQHLPAIAADIRDALLTRFRNGVLVGLSDTTSAPTRPGQRKARLLLEVLRARPEDVLRFTHDLQVPPHLESDRTRPTTQQDRVPRARKGEADVDRVLLMCVTEQEMEVGPPESSYRRWLETTAYCAG